MKISQDSGRWLARFGLVGALTALASPVWADEVGEENINRGAVVHPKNVGQARAIFSEGVKHFDEGDYPKAKVEFDRAYELAPNYKLLYNIGLVQQRLGDFAGAMRSFEGYLSQGAWEVTDARVAEVSKTLSELSPRVGSINVKGTVPRVQVAVDGVFVGQTPLDDVVTVNPGEHTITGKRDGFTPVSKSLSLKNADLVDVDLSLTEIPTAAPYIRGAVLFGGLLGLVLVLRRFGKRSTAPAKKTSAS